MPCVPRSRAAHMVSLWLLVLHAQAPCLGRAPPAGSSPFPDGGQGQWQRAGRERGAERVPPRVRCRPEQRGSGALLGREGRPAGLCRPPVLPGALPALPRRAAPNPGHSGLAAPSCGSRAVIEFGCAEVKVLLNPAFCRSSSFRGKSRNPRVVLRY